MSTEKIQINGSFDTKQNHVIKTAAIDAAISDWQAIATTFATNVIRDQRTRERYMAHVEKISRDVKSEVEAGRLTVKEGAEYCNQMRDRLFVEYRKYTSAVGVATAEKMKITARGFDYYLNKYSQSQFGKQFNKLTERQRGKIYYSVIESAGRPNTKVNVKLRKLEVRGKVMLIVTALLATERIIDAKDKVKEAARQGSIIAGGLLGGGIAGFGVSFICGPAEPVCAAALVFIGSSLGGMVGQLANDVYQDELDEFNRWMSP